MSRNGHKCAWGEVRRVALRGGARPSRTAETRAAEKDRRRFIHF